MTYSGTGAIITWCFTSRCLSVSLDFMSRYRICQETNIYVAFVNTKPFNHTLKIPSYGSRYEECFFSLDDSDSSNIPWNYHDSDEDTVYFRVPPRDSNEALQEWMLTLINNQRYAWSMIIYIYVQFVSLRLTVRSSWLCWLERRFLLKIIVL
jgi:hypothetical protein